MTKNEIAALTYDELQKLRNDYRAKSADKGKAEIIIGKQRNGPIGTVNLTFQGQYTRFDNLARGIGLGEIRFIELTESRAGSARARRDDEARQMTSKLGDGAVVILLDERGTSGGETPTSASGSGSWSMNTIAVITFVMLAMGRGVRLFDSQRISWLAGS